MSVNVFHEMRTMPYYSIACSTAVALLLVAVFCSSIYFVSICIRSACSDAVKRSHMDPQGVWKDVASLTAVVPLFVVYLDIIHTYRMVAVLRLTATAA